MNNFEKFVSLPVVTQQRIIRTALRIDRETLHRIEFYTLADALTEGAWLRRQQRQEQREEQARYNWPDAPPKKSGTY
jgi:hypothetical protein